MVLGAVLALGDFAHAEVPMVAIVPGVAVSLDAARSDALAQDLAEALQTELEVRAIGGLGVRRRLPERVAPDCFVQPACIDEVARRLGAAQLLFVVMIDTGATGAIRIDSTWVDVSTHAHAARPPVSIAAIANARSYFASAARQLLPGATPRARRPGISETPAIPRHVTLPSYLTAGGAALGLGLGVGFGLSARSRYRSCDARSTTEQPCSIPERDAIRSRALVADLGWLVGLGSAVATSVLYATSGTESRLILEPTPGGVALTAVGTFR